MGFEILLGGKSPEERDKIKEDQEKRKKGPSRAL